MQKTMRRGGRRSGLLFEYDDQRERERESGSCFVVNAKVSRVKVVEVHQGGLILS